MLFKFYKIDNWPDNCSNVNKLDLLKLTNKKQYFSDYDRRYNEPTV